MSLEQQYFISTMDEAITRITPHDLFAAAALNAIIGDKDMVRTGGKALREDPNAFIAKMAFLAADAMMAERAKHMTIFTDARMDHQENQP